LLVLSPDSPQQHFVDVSDKAPNQRQIRELPKAGVHRRSVVPDLLHIMRCRQVTFLTGVSLKDI